MDIETPDHLRVLFQELLLNYFMLYYLHKGEVEKEHLVSADQKWDQPLSHK